MKSSKCEKPVDSDVSMDNSEPSISLPIDLFDKLHSYIALSNNYLMSISVEGDKILQSAELMNKAMELHKELDHAKKDAALEVWFGEDDE